MMEKEFTKEEIEINYALIKRIEEHARKYDEAIDKKDFLKKACAYEQKIILMNSSKPYEVLNYLDELDIESSRLILNELDPTEISKIISLFTSEDKRNFYKTFTNLELVNQFIVQDENSKDYVINLSIPRKVELMDSSNSETVLASSIVYESIPPQKREQVSQSLTNADAVSALSKTPAYKEDAIINELKTSHADEVVENKTISECPNEEIKEILKEEFEENVKEQLKEKLEEEEILAATKVFFMERLKYYKETVPEFKEIDIDKEDVFESLPLELRAIIDRDFEISKNSKIEETTNDEQQDLNTEVNKKYEKVNKNVDVLLNSTIEDFVIRTKSIAIFNKICQLDDSQKEIFKTNCPELYEQLKGYFNEKDIFVDLESSTQEEIIKNIQNNPFFKNEFSRTIQIIEETFNQKIKTELEKAKIDIYNNSISKNSDILSQLNIIGKNNYSELIEEEKIRVSNYIVTSAHYVKELRTISNNCSQKYNIHSRCVKDNISHDDLILCMEDKDKFKSYLSSALNDEDIFIDNRGNLNVTYKNSSQKELDANYYKKYSIVGNGESYIGIVSNPQLVDLFTQKKQECEIFEIDKLESNLGYNDASKTLG